MSNDNKQDNFGLVILSQYGWSLFVLLILIGSLTYFDVLGTLFPTDEDLCVCETCYIDNESIYNNAVVCCVDSNYSKIDGCVKTYLNYGLVEITQINLSSTE